MARRAGPITKRKKSPKRRRPPERSGPVASGFDWISVGDLHVRADVQIDALTAVMLAMVTFVSLLVAIYASGYMHGDPGYSRFFAELSLFVFSMCMLVMARNFVVLFVFWEAVGLCSYLLVGFWFERPIASAAAVKAFVMNRIGDAAFLVGPVLDLADVSAVSISPTCSAARRPSPSRRRFLDSRPDDLPVPVHRARAANRPSFRCTCGCPTRWKARRR